MLNPVTFLFDLRSPCANLAPSSQSSSGPGDVDYYGLTLTAEEIKDIVCSTSLWLVVRENIGGVGKVRKGDGWKIRA